MTALIIDDEQRSINNLRKIIESYCPDIKLVIEANNINIGEELILEKKPDIIFLDIEMPNGNGFDLINKLADKKLNIIFVTAFDTYAVEAFRKNAIDYLLKPIDVDYLLEAIEKVKKNLQAPQQIIEKFPTLFNTNKLKLPTMDGFELIETEQILFAKSSGNYTHLFLKQEKKYIVSKNIGEIEKLLMYPTFLRIHNEHIVNINEIARYVNGRGGYVILKTNQHLDVAYRRKQNLLALLAS
jgi:two-component system, LytTR family, response regulator